MKYIAFVLKFVISVLIVIKFDQAGASDNDKSESVRKIKTEYFFLPQEGQFVLDTSLESSVYNFKIYGVNNLEINTAQTEVPIQLQLGITDSSSFNFSTSYVKVRYATSGKENLNSGFGDWSLTYQMRSKNFYLKLGFGFPFEPIKYGSNNIKSNVTSGENVGILAGGFIYDYGKFNFGSYLYRKSVNSREIDSSTTITGGSKTSLSLFSEYNYGEGFLTTEYSLIYFSYIHNSSYPNFINGYFMHLLNLSGTYNLDSNLSLKAGLAYYSIPAYDYDDAGTYVRGTNFFLTSLGLKYIF